MERKRPRSIRYHDGNVGPVRWVTSSLAQGERLLGGYADIEKRTTTLSREERPSFEGYYLLHELCHHALYPLLPMSGGEREDGIEEQVVKTISTHLSKMWKLNPAAFLWIHEQLTGQKIAVATKEKDG